jgi:nucleoside 2-deoxyribosyltransferase
LEFFLAYHHDDNHLAGKVKQELERRGFSAFLAHEDIEPSATWREEILKHLKSCMALVAIVTKRFGDSSYANQEVGFVIGKGKPVISLNFSEGLPGFLESLQAIKTTEGNIVAAATKATKFVEGKDPATYIESVLKRTEEIEDIALNEVKRHILRTGKDSRNVSVLDENIKLDVITPDESGNFVVIGTATSIRKGSTSLFSLESDLRKSWNWRIQIDPSGRILGKSITEVSSHPI